MKKYTIVLIAVALTAVFAVTAMANEWNLYGSARMETFYKNNKLEDRRVLDPADRDSIKNTTWLFQNNSRVGATVKGENLSARFEFGARPAVRDSGAITNFANVRRLYGEWKFSDNWGLKVGKDYTPITFFLSGQVVNADAGLLQVGNAYGARRGLVELGGMGFKIAFIDPAKGNFTFVDDDPADGLTYNGVGTENYFPKIEASYLWKHGDLGGTHFFGGYNNTKAYFSQQDAVGTVLNQASETINSWVFGLGGEYNFGPMFVKPQLSYYINGGSGGWLGGSIINASGIPGLAAGDINTGALLVGNDVVDANSFMGMLALGFAPTEQLTLELGGGFLYNRSKDDNAVNLKDHTYYELYLQAVYAMAPGVFLVPEIGYQDYGKLDFEDATPSADIGSLWYFGAKWQINF